MYNKELDNIIRTKTDPLHKHIEILKKRIEELEETNKKIKGTTKWVEDND